MVLLELGALRFVGLQADLASLPIDTTLLGATFDATDTLNRYLFDGANWVIAPDTVPLTTKGDLFTFDTDFARLPVGGDGQILSANSVTATGLEWITPNIFSSPLTTDGDVMIYNTTDVRLGIGALNQVLTVSAGGFPEWANAQGLSPLTTDGDIIIYNGGDIRLPIGTANQVLAVSALGFPEWVPTPPASTPLTTKGDILGFTTLDARIPVGTDGQILTANSVQALGVEWIDHTAPANAALIDQSNAWGAFDQDIATGGKWQEGGVNISPIGPHDIYFDAKALKPLTTGGADAVTSEELGALGQERMIEYMNFAPSVESHATGRFIFPQNWDAGSYDVEFCFYSDTVFTGTENVRWQVKATSVSEGGILTQSFPTAVDADVTPPADTAKDLHFSIFVTMVFNSSPVKGDLILMDIARAGDNPGDTFLGEARLVSLRLRPTIDAAVAA